MSKLNRRTVLKGAAAAATVIGAPRFVRNAFASSGELNFMGWAGYDFKAAFAAFTKATGIKVNFNEQPDQDAMFAQCKLALQTGSVDVVEPTLDRYGGWVSNGILQPWDPNKLVLANYLDGVPGGKPGDAGELNGKRYFVPSVWGTEALVYSKKDAPETYGTASLADLFDPKYEGKVTVRAHSSLAALGRVMDGQGKLPKPFLEGYKDEASMKAIWDVVLAEAIKHKANVAQWWASENEAQGAFRTNGCVLGLCWDSTGANMASEGFGFIAPKEGAFAWSQGFVEMANAKNVDQAHEWAKWVSTAEGAAAWASAFKANAVGKGGVELADQGVKDFYKAAYPGDALQKLWWWPPQDAWFVKLRGEYADKFKAA
ncbi:MAG TPA: extracellular solute-binding protein [Dongiaceae bacterium]|nr:extracellular solute-binding protein [Dongiaceae bacterium]